MKESVQVDVLERSAAVGDIYLLCSDGLSGMVDDPRARLRPRDERISTRRASGSSTPPTATAGTTTSPACWRGWNPVTIPFGVTIASVSVPSTVQSGQTTTRSRRAPAQDDAAGADDDLGAQGRAGLDGGGGGDGADGAGRMGELDGARKRFQLPER